MDKKVLVVTYDFPPRRTSAVYRLTFLTKYLAQSGWRPTVLTIDGRAGDTEEPGLLDQLPPAVHIERTRHLSVDGWENSAAKGIRAAGGLKSRDTDARQPFFDRWVRSLGSAVRSVLYFPDFSSGWVPYGLARGTQLHARERFDVVYTSEPPRSASPIGLFLKLLLGVPWVFELMDPWYPPPGSFRPRFEKWFLAFMLRRADAVVVMIEGHAKDLHEQFGIPLEKIWVVPNGFDEGDFRDPVVSASRLFEPSYFNMAHFGTIYPRNSGKFFDAVAELVQERPELRQRLRLHLFGFPGDPVRQKVASAGLHDVVTFRNFIPAHADVLQAMYTCDCLLLFWGDLDFSRLAVAGKTYVYLRTGRPILAVTGPGGVRERIERASAGWVVHPDDIGEIKQRILQLIGDRDAGRPLPSTRQDYVSQFRWDRLARELSLVFEGVVRQ